MPRAANERVTFWFSHEDRRLSELFIALCKEKGISGRLRTHDHYWRFRITLSIEGKELEAFTEEWGKRSVVRQN